MKSGNIRCALTGAYALGSWLLWTGSAPAQAPFYQDKTITVVAATDAGGTADLRIRDRCCVIAQTYSRQPDHRRRVHARRRRTQGGKSCL